MIDDIRYMFVNPLGNGKSYIFAPAGKYIVTENVLVFKLAQECHGGSIDNAVDDFIDNHAVNFEKVWEDNPDKRRSMVEYYWRNYIETDSG